MTRLSGKLARWALTIQDMDLTIRHTNANVLSCCPAEEGKICAVEQKQNYEMSGLPEFEKVSQCQMEDDELSTMISYLCEGTLPEKKHKFCYVVLESKHFEVVEDELYHESSAFPGH